MNILKLYYKCLIGLVLVMVFTACEAVTDDPSTCPYSQDQYVLSFRMLTESPLLDTRSDSESWFTRSDPQHSEVDSEWRDFEDYIDKSDIMLAIFAKAPGDNSTETLLATVDNLGSSTNPQQMITGSPGAYTITMAFDKDEFAEKLKYEPDVNGSGVFQFRIVIIANSNLWGNRWNNGQLTGPSFEQLIAQAQKWSCIMPYEHNDGDSQVAGLYKGHIPMFGVNTFNVSEVDLIASKAEERFFLGNIDMLRSVAKVRVVDNISNKDADGFPYIAEVEFISSQTIIRPLPYDAVNYENGTQVHTPNIFEPDKVLTLTGAQEYKLGTISGSMDMTPAEQKKGVTRIGYVPEQKIANINGNIDQGMPAFRILVATGKNDTREYIVPMTGYTSNGGTEGTKFNFGDNILRNHVYTLSVNKVVMGSPADITVNVAEWGSHELTLDFTESLTVSNRLQWVDGTFATIDQNMVITRPWTVNGEGLDIPVPVQGTFAIRTPQGARWTAYLLDTEGPDSNAFAFYDVDSEGNYILGDDGLPKMFDSVSGTVEEDAKALTKLYVVSRNKVPSGTEANKAVLQVVVTVGEGASASVMEAILVPEGAPFINYTIVQNPE